MWCYISLCYMFVYDSGQVVPISRHITIRHKLLLHNYLITHVSTFEHDAGQFVTKSSALVVNAHDDPS